MAYIEGKEIVKIVETGDTKKLPSDEALFECIVNKDEVSKFIKIPSIMFKGPKGPDLAALTI